MSRPTLLLLMLAWASTASASDPTRPPSPAEIEAWLRGGSVAENAETVTFQLQSLLLSDQRQVAVINGQSVTIGDSIDDARVVSIDAGRVELARNGERLILTITTRLSGGPVRD